MEKEDKEKDNPGNSQFIASAVMGKHEYIELKELSAHMGVSMSHLNRALIRMGMKTMRKHKPKESVLLQLIKLGGSE